MSKIHTIYCQIFNAAPLHIFTDFIIIFTKLYLYSPSFLDPQPTTHAKNFVVVLPYCSPALYSRALKAIMKIRVLEVIGAILLHLLAVDWIKWNPPIPGQRENIVFTVTYKGLSLIVEFCGTYDAAGSKSVTITLNNNGRVLGFGGWNWYDCDGFMWFKYNNFHDCIEALRTYIEEASP
jgi:hypothetical protein